MIRLSWLLFPRLLPPFVPLKLTLVGDLSVVGSSNDFESQCSSRALLSGWAERFRRRG